MAMKPKAAKKPKVVPQAGETEYVVINPGQVEKIEEAILKAASKAGFNVRPGVDFWASLTSSLTMALIASNKDNQSKYDEMAFVACEDGKALAKRLRNGK